VQVRFNDDVTDVENIDVIANLRFEDSMGQKWIKFMRDPRSVQMSKYAIYPPTFSTNSLQDASKGRVDLRSLATVGQPLWCSRQAKKSPSETTICSQPRLAALDVIMTDKHYNSRLSNAAAAEKQEVQAEQGNWIAKRDNAATMKIACSVHT
jgi:uncharacterized protein YecT (DUF1311 family)